MCSTSVRQQCNEYVSKSFFYDNHLTKGLYMVMKIVISLKTFKKILYAVKYEYRNFINFYDLKARLLFCGEHFEETFKM